MKRTESESTGKAYNLGKTRRLRKEKIKATKCVCFGLSLSLSPCVLSLSLPLSNQTESFLFCFSYLPWQKLAPRGEETRTAFHQNPRKLPKACQYNSQRNRKCTKSLKRTRGWPLRNTLILGILSGEDQVSTCGI